MGLTEKERELVEAIRNFKKSRHNPSKGLEKWAIALFENLMYDDEQDEGESTYSLPDVPKAKKTWKQY